jgi:hypothetical protein
MFNHTLVFNPLRSVSSPSVSDVKHRPIALVSEDKVIMGPKSREGIAKCKMQIENLQTRQLTLKRLKR